MSDFQLTRRRFLYAASAAIGAAVGSNTRMAAASAAPAKSAQETDTARFPGNPATYTFTLPTDGSRLIGEVHHVQARQQDTLLDIGRRFDVGYRDIALANPNVDIWLPGEGTNVVLPNRFVLPDAPREGIVVNIPETRLYYYPHTKRDEPRRVITHPIGIGRQNWHTPLGRANVIDKIPNPAWYPPASIRAEHAATGEPLPALVPPGPDNPLGQFALILNLPGYLIHGTIRPYGVGERVSHGCIRLYPEDIKALFPQVPRGTPVYIVDQPYKAAWDRGRLYLEAQALPGYNISSSASERYLPPALAKLFNAVSEALRGSGYGVDWDRLEREASVYSGIPYALSLI